MISVSYTVKTVGERGVAYCWNLGIVAISIVPSCAVDDRSDNGKFV